MRRENGTRPEHPIYKILDRQYARGFLTGEALRIGTLRDFKSNDDLVDGIRDCSEGTAKNTFDGYIHNTDDMSSVERANLASMGMYLGPGADQVNISDFQSQTSFDDVYIFCACKNMPALSEFNSTIRGETGNQVVLKIDSAAIFGERLGMCLAANGLSDTVDMRVVKYGDEVRQIRLTDLGRHNAIQLPDPFFKSRRFEKQDEFRFVFYPLKTKIVPFILNAKEVMGGDWNSDGLITLIE